MYYKSSLGIFLLFLLSASAATQAQLDAQFPEQDDVSRNRRHANKPTKPLFPNFFPPPPEETQYYANPIPDEHAHAPGAPCPNPTTDHSSHSPSQYRFQPPPQQFQQQPGPQVFPPGASTLPPIPELFRKSTTTPQPSIFQVAAATESATQRPITPPPPSRIQDTRPTSATTEIPRFTSSRTQKPTRTNELFPATLKPSRDQGGRKLDFTGLPERIVYPPPNFNPPQPPQPNFDDAADQSEREHRPNLNSPSIKYKIAVVADLGKDAKITDGRFKSFLKEGNIYVQKSKEDPQKYNVTIDLDANTVPFVLESKLNNDNEGFELSTLNVFNGKLYSCDDETGIIYELVQVPIDLEAQRSNAQRAGGTPERNTSYVAQPWIILSNEGENSGFRCEWATVKDEHLWVGSTGILVRKPGEENAEDKTRQGVKKVSPGGTVVHLDWTKNYEKISESIGLPAHKGFSVHEGVAWSDHLQRWLFTPRRISTERYDKKVYHKRGGNTAIFVDDTFENFKMEHLGDLVETAGFTSIKFIPGTDDQLILALKAGFNTQTNQLMSTLEVFDINGEEVAPEVSIGNGIYAGVEFV